ncbi:carbonic anhydrase [Lyophyllum atratum]|nr:carbonic anhydrase [Lyophyllum atratum]
MSAHQEFRKRNDAYVATFDKGGLALPPAKKYIVVTCMDARVEPAGQLGIDLGDAHVIRNAGGCAKEALRSVVISQRLLGTREIAVFHHTGCGMLTFSTEHLRKVVKDSEPGNSAVAEAVDKIDFLEFGHLENSIKSDVKFLQENPLVLKDTKVTGWVYDVTTGKVWSALASTDINPA